MRWANAEGRSKGDVGKVIIFADLSDQGLDCSRIGNAFPGIGVENRPTRVFRLYGILQIEGFKNIVGKIYLELS